MKLHKTIIPVLMVLLAIGSSCTKDMMKYENDPRVYFYERANVNATTFTQITTRSFSFAPFPTTVKDTTLYIRVKIMGVVAPTDRTFAAEAIAAGTTAIAGTNYKFLPGTVKANEMEGFLPVVLYRTAELKTELKQLKIKLSDANDFKTGTVENNTFSLAWNDDYLKPDNWNPAFGTGLVNYFGVYSVVKYKFIIEVLGISQFPLQTAGYNPLQFSNADMLDKKAALKTALAVYNSTHTPVLTDEFGVVVTFPQ